VSTRTNPHRAPAHTNPKRKRGREIDLPSLTLRVSVSRTKRRGLAPLEFVLCLPVLLFVLALIVDTGSKSCWKLRGVVAARDAAWRSRWDRSAGNVANPASWPAPATMGVTPAPATAMLNKRQLTHRVVRGPTLGTFLVRNELLDQTRGGRNGESDRTWSPPLLPKLGSQPMSQQHPLIDDKWQYTQMGIPATNWRRIPYLYTLPQTDPELKAAFLNAVAAIQPLRPALDVLDRDEEVRAWLGYYYNFHPRVSFCDLDRARVATNQLAMVVRRVQGGLTTIRPRNGIPGTLTRFWINMYTQQRNALLARIEQIQAGLATGSIPELLAQAAVLEAKIALLQGYLDTLP
jgi:hypothetical protein